VLIPPSLSSETLPPRLKSLRNKFGNGKQTLRIETKLVPNLEGTLGVPIPWKKMERKKIPGLKSL